MKVVYIASPYTQGDVGENVRVQIEAAHLILDMGHAPLAPNLSHFLHLFRTRPYEDWMRADFAVIAKCDVLLRLPGPSKGADREVELAKRLGIPVAYGWSELGKLLNDLSAVPKPQTKTKRSMQRFKHTTTLAIALLTLAFTSVAMRAAPTITYHNLGGYFEGHDDRAMGETLDYREWLTWNGTYCDFSNELTNIFRTDHNPPANWVGLYGGCYLEGNTYCVNTYQLWNPGRYKTNWFGWDQQAPWPNQELIPCEKIKTKIDYTYGGYHHWFAGTNIMGFKIVGDRPNWDVTVHLVIEDCRTNVQSYMHEIHDVHTYPARTPTAWTQDWFLKCAGSQLGNPLPGMGYWEWTFVAPNNTMLDCTPRRNAGDPDWIQWHLAEPPEVTPHQH